MKFEIFFGDCQSFNGVSFQGYSIMYSRPTDVSIEYPIFVNWLLLW